VFGITRVSSGRCGAVSIDLDELITEHYGITRAEVAPELESLPSIRPRGGRAVFDALSDDVATLFARRAANSPGRCGLREVTGHTGH
jgi:hypothetical protein